MVPNSITPSPSMLPYQNLMQPMMPQGMIWVKKQEAPNYPMPRGATLPLFDSDDDVFYLKTVDVYGNTQPLRTFRYEEITQSDDQAPKEQAVSIDEFNALKQEMAELKEEMMKRSSTQNDNRKPYRKENRNNG